VMSIINNPGNNYKSNLRHSISLLGEVKSVNLKLYAKALYIMMTGKNYAKAV
jgi:hypothetical protein